jgi:uncharacterized protein (DUF1800 family)
MTIKSIKSSIKSKYLVLSLFILVSSILPGNATAKPADSKILHLINRLSFGFSPGDIERVESMGIDSYIKEQLTPDAIPEPQSLTKQLSGLSTFNLTAAELLKEYTKSRPQGQKPTVEQMQAARKRIKQVEQEAVQAKLLRATTSPRQLQEVMVEFWYNHFNVYVGKGRDRFLVGAYEKDAIRPHTLGRFRDLLGATARHPAMLFYLDNWQNTAPNSPGARGRFQGLNENYARELMELHTLGVDGGYSQQDVISLARIFTGWGLAGTEKQTGDSSGFYFNAKRHDFGEKTFLGQTIKGSGEAEGNQALDILARSPITARHISYKLAQYFVSDSPPDALVQKLQKRFLATDGNIRDVLDTLFHSQEFWDAKNFNAKFKTPLEYTISAIRATGTPVNNTKPISTFLQQLGMPVYGWQTPDGYKNTAAAWLNPDAMTRRLSFVTNLANGSLPISGIPFKQIKQNQNQQISRTSPVDAGKLEKTIGNSLSAKTQNAISTSNSSKLRAALILGSPEFMHR